jgi:hypothetical protein
MGEAEGARGHDLGAEGRLVDDEVTTFQPNLCHVWLDNGARRAITTLTQAAGMLPALAM